MKHFSLRKLKGIALFCVTLQRLLISPVNAEVSKETSVNPGLTDNFYEAKAKLWISKETGRINGVIVFIGGTDSDQRAFVDKNDWQQIAKKNALALVGLYFRGDGEHYEDAAGGSGAALIKMLEDLAKKTKVPGLKSAPLFLVGHSAGAMFAYNFLCWMPQRSIGAIIVKSGPIFSPSPSVLRIPALFIIGEQDEPNRRIDILNLFENRGNNTHWSLAVQANSGHEWNFALDEFVRRYILSALPELFLNQKRNGVTRDLLLNDVHKSSDNMNVMWFPNATTAALWAHFTKFISIAKLIENSNAIPISKNISTRYFSPSILSLGSLSQQEISGVGIKRRLYITVSPKNSPYKFVSYRKEIKVDAISLGNGRYELSLFFLPRAIPTGPFTSSITAITNTSSLSHSVELQITANIRSPAIVRPGSLYLGTLSRDAVVEREVKVDWPMDYARRITLVRTSNPAFAKATFVGMNPTRIRCRFEGKPLGNQSGYFEIVFDNDSNKKTRLPFIALVSR